MVSTLSPDGAFQVQYFTSQFNTDFTLTHSSGCFSTLLNNYLGGLQCTSNGRQFCTFQKKNYFIIKIIVTTQNFLSQNSPKVKKIRKFGQHFLHRIAVHAKGQINVRDKNVQHVIGVGQRKNASKKFLTE